MAPGRQGLSLVGILRKISQLKTTGLFLTAVDRRLVRCLHQRTGVNQVSLHKVGWNGESRMTAEQFLRDGDLRAALAQLQQQIKSSPAAVEPRVFLFQLLVV